MNKSCKTEEKLSNGWHGSLNLVYAQRQNTTQVIHNQVKAPLKVQRPFYPEGSEVCHSIILHTAGGIVGGDRLSLNFHLEPNSKALITTAAASKIYRSNGLQARQKSGISCRYRGSNCTEVRNWFISVWHLLRLSYLGRPSCIPRVWQI